jgi:beta-glucosidase
LPNSEVGITQNFTGFEPGSDHPADLDAAERARIYEDRLFLDPLLRGGYPLLEGHPVIDASEDDLATIAAPIDFLGVNWYGPSRVVHPWHRPRRGEAGGPPAADLAQLFDGHADLFGYARVPIPDAPTTVMGWPVLPDRFGEVLGWLRRDYPSLPPVYITENGLPCLDRVDADGAVHDAVRIEYLSGCLRQLAAAIADGMDIRGYYVWSLLDNLEWGLGYRPRFGLVHVDFDTLQRSPKDSFYWYRDVISAHRSRAGAVDHSTAVGE